jgi:transposase
VRRRRFSREFKVEAVKLVRERGVSAALAARDLDVHEDVLRKWVREFGPDPVQRSKNSDLPSRLSLFCVWIRDIILIFHTYISYLYFTWRGRRRLAVISASDNAETKVEGIIPKFDLIFASPAVGRH